MIRIEPDYEDKAVILTISGEVTVDDIKKALLKSLPIMQRLRDPGFAVVSDLRELKSSNSDVESILTDNMRILVTMGMKVAARVFKDARDPILKRWQEKNVQAGYLAQYFLVIEKAYEFCKKE